MIYRDKDPTLAAYLKQVGLQKLGYYTGAADNWWGTQSESAYQAFLRSLLTGDGWGFTVQMDGADLVIPSGSCTWFGGDSDPLDNGETASGVRTKGNPNVLGCALPVIPGHKSTKGSPLAFTPAQVGNKPNLKPAIPWHTPVVFTRLEKTVVAPLIDNGPAKSARDPADLTVAAFKALGGSLAQGVLHNVHIRVVGAATHYLTAKLADA